MVPEPTVSRIVRSRAANICNTTTSPQDIALGELHYVHMTTSTRHSLLFAESILAQGRVLLEVAGKLRQIAGYTPAQAALVATPKPGTSGGRAYRENRYPLGVNSPDRYEEANCRSGKGKLSL